MKHLNKFNNTPYTQLKVIDAYNKLNSFYLRKHWPKLMEPEPFWKTVLQQVGVVVVATLTLLTFFGLSLSLGAWVAYQYILSL